MPQHYFEELDYLPAEEVLAWGIRTFSDSFGISTSFQKSGMVILDMAFRLSPNVRVFTLDTGRLPEETHAMIDMVRARYGAKVEVVTPDPREVEAMVRQHGSNLFYTDPSLRLLCCHVRKVKPLERKLAEFRAYAVGLRRLTSNTRNEIRKVEVVKGAIKLAPIADWTRQEIDGYIQRHGVPTHPLYARGYTSIGCAPCTRATAEDEDERAGRWWWEQDARKECGIHFTANGTVGRQLDVLIQGVSPAPGARAH
ncbi:MAG: phosphoadenylyl-sulfate reductase [Bryobacteraceae bacterium]|nr:phosphoadenylyl-sulfate reductase [Bryobacteraceae bacterium]